MSSEVHLLKGDDPTLVGHQLTALVRELVGDADRSLVLEELDEDRYRTDDGLPPGEGAFGIASFWAVDCRCLQGDVEGAAAAFERLCALANDVGLFAEEIDPTSGAQLGNFPQAFTHLALIDAAVTLDDQLTLRG